MLDAWRSTSPRAAAACTSAQRLLLGYTCHPEKPWMIEVRKCESGRAPGRPSRRVLPRDHRRAGRPLAQPRAGAAEALRHRASRREGFDHSVGYIQMPDARDPRAAFILRGRRRRRGDRRLRPRRRRRRGLRDRPLRPRARHAAELAAARLEPRALGELPARVRGDLLQLPGPRRDERLHGAGRPRLLHDARGRRGLLDELDRLVRLALAQRLPQQRLPGDAQRARPLRLARAAAALDG